MTDDYKDWNWFKELVKRTRKQQNELIREQGGRNQVMISIDLVAYDIEDWVHLNPHSINLKTGKTSAFVYDKYREIDVKYLFQMQRLDEAFE